jgi:hypothetical protein
MTIFSTPFYYRDPDELPTPLNIPTTFRQNETPSWEDDEYEDVNGNVYSSATYTLTYYLAGPVSAPVSLIGVPSVTGSAGWTTTISPAKAALLLPGLYWWQGVLTATNFRLVAGENELTVQVDYGAVSGVYDGRTTAEKALAACELALATFQGSNGRVKRYQIGNRSMEFQDIKQIMDLMYVWRARVASEKDLADGGRSRKLLVRFSHAH